MARRVLLVHGLWMHAPVLYFWARKLRAAGYRTEYFSYQSLLQRPEHAAARLRAEALAESDTDILAHSLGGLIVLEALAGCRNFGGRILCVGSPLAGSRIVRQYRDSVLGTLAGHSTALLSRGFTQVPDGLDVSVIAGTNAKGLGRLVHRFDEPNDGSVAVSETWIPGLRRHLSVPVSHSGQLFSNTVMTHILALLNRGV
jgi:pimeloyl-ACP methyl ester carboxylesterase